MQRHVGPLRSRQLVTAIAATLAIFGPSASSLARADGIEPSYWRTRMFLIPYQPPVDRLAAPVAKVQLLIARPADGQWSVLQEAESHVRGFSYHAPVDGEYAFAVRTLDRQGAPSPATIIQPQLRVVVDTTPPSLELTATPDAAGRIVVRYEGRDPQLKPETLRLEAQTDGVSWQRIATGPPDLSQPDRLLGQVAWKPPASAADVRFRGVIDDRAGNQVSATAAASLVGPLLSSAAGPTLGSAWGAADSPAPADPPINPLSSASLFSAPAIDWPSRASDGAGGPTTVAQTAPDPRAAPQGHPYSSSSAPRSVEPTSPQAPPLWPSERPLAQLIADGGDVSGPSTRDPFAPPPLVGPAWNPSSAPTPPAAMQPHGAENWTSIAEPTPTDADGTRWVNSLTFDVDYDLQTVGPWGVAKVELYATRDGGRQWLGVGVDPDNRSPMRVTVPEAGVYGFRLTVSSAGGTPASPPAAGDQPELTIGVDLTEPRAELHGAEFGPENLADCLIIRWSADDESLDARPIGLFYAANPEGPWLTIATDIDDNGQYAWRLLQQVPERLFLRLEVRDKAGNVAVRQSPAPVALNLPQPTGALRNVRPVQNAPQRFRTASGQEIRSQ